jgi:hypothetical protein
MLVDHEAEEPYIVSLLQNEEPPFDRRPSPARFMAAPTPAKRRDTFDESGVLRGMDRRNDHPALRILGLKGSAILGAGPAGIER